MWASSWPSGPGATASWRPDTEAVVPSLLAGWSAAWSAYGVQDDSRGEQAAWAVAIGAIVAVVIDYGTLPPFHGHDPVGLILDAAVMLGTRGVIALAGGFLAGQLIGRLLKRGS